MGKLFVISAPSGAGKTSLVRACSLRGRTWWCRCRTPRASRAPTKSRGATTISSRRRRFHELVAAGAFLEHAQVFDNFYGTGAAAGARQARGRQGRAAGDRLAGRAPGAPRDARQHQHLHPAALARGARAAAARTPHRQRRDHRAPAGRRRPATCRTTANSTTWWSTTSSSSAAADAGRDPRRRRARAALRAQPRRELRASLMQAHCCCRELPHALCADGALARRLAADAVHLTATPGIFRKSQSHGSRNRRRLSAERR